MVDSVEYDFHLLPSGIINPNVTAFIGEYFNVSTFIHSDISRTLEQIIQHAAVSELSALNLFC